MKKTRTAVVAPAPLDPWVERKLAEGQTEVTLRSATGPPVSVVVAPHITRLIEQLLLADLKDKSAAIQAKLDDLYSERLVIQARALVEKGGASL